MSTKQATKCELQKLKALTESTELWSRRVHKFWKSTTDVCQNAGEAFQSDSSAASHLQTRLKDSTECVCQCVENVRDVAHNRYIDLQKSFQEKSKSKQKGGSCKDLGRRMEYASVEISAAVFSTFQIQADHLDQLTRAVLEFERDQLCEKSPVKPTGQMGEQSLQMKKRIISCDENNIELDWDAFDRELTAVSEVVDKMGQEGESEQIQQLKRQLRQVQNENGQLMKRAILAEQALGRAEKDKSELKDQIDTGYNQDDFMEMRRALRKEQLARLEAEQRLRDAQEEIKAAQFAFKVAKAVANRIADSAEIAQGSLVRCQSERHIPERCPPICNSASADIDTPTETGHCRSAPEFRSEGSSVDVVGSESESAAPVGRTDSAFFGEETAEEESTPIQSSTDSEPTAEAVQPTNPFLESTEELEANNPFLIEATDLPNEKLDITSNPFSLESDACPSVPQNLDSLSPDLDSSNPFLTSTAPTEHEEEKTEEWNPFTATPCSNPFLS